MSSFKEQAEEFSKGLETILEKPLTKGVTSQDVHSWQLPLNHTAKAIAAQGYMPFLEKAMHPDNTDSLGALTSSIQMQAKEGTVNLQQPFFGIYINTLDTLYANDQQAVLDWLSNYLAANQKQKEEKKNEPKKTL